METHQHTMKTDDHLCDFCAQALTIDDSLGSIKTADDGTTALDMTTFELNNWMSIPTAGQQESRYLRGSILGGDSGWTQKSSDSLGRKRHNRYVCASQGLEKVVTTSALAENQSPTVQKCRFCQRLEEIFREEYSQCTWWNDPVSLLRITMQYEWTVFRMTLQGKELAETSESEKRTFNEISSLDSPWGSGLEGKPWDKRQRMKCLVVLVNHPGHENPKYADVYQFDVAAKSGRCRDWLKIQYNAADPAGPFSDENLQLVKERIDDCIENHPNLNYELRGTSVVPTRVLDIGADGHVRLVKTKHLLSRSYQGRSADLDFKYAALSYCWGSPESATPMRTTKAIRKTYEVQGISEQDIPATFIDAIFIARKLGIQYLWIDALCIIQDDLGDWEAESSRMSDVFMNSYVTICAAASPSSSKSFLVQPPKEVITLPFCSSLDPEVSGTYSILLEGHRSRSSVVDLDIRDQKWRTRGWIWQEEVLSTRSLIFGKSLVQYRCHGWSSMESGLSSPIQPPAHIQGILDTSIWRDVVTDYSKRQLTFSRDRLGAIAGVAKCFCDGKRLRGESVKYLAGLWLIEPTLTSWTNELRRLAGQLRWVCSPGPTMTYTAMMEMLQDRENYCAPSWSWASRMTGVTHVSDGAPSGLIYEISGHDVQPAQSDAMIRVKFGSSITLRGSIFKTPLIPITGDFIADARDCTSRWVTTDSSRGIKFWLDWKPNTDDSKEKVLQSQLQLFFLTAPYGFKFLPDRKRTGGLLLLPHDRPQGTVYHGVGVFQYQTDPKGLQFLRESEAREVTII